MDKKEQSADLPEVPATPVRKTDLNIYMLNPPGEDIYDRAEEEQDADPENPGKKKSPNEGDTRGLNNEKDFEDDISGEDLDVPGAELDDEQEANGNEDEENNNYSLGGDLHNDLDENNEF